MLETIFIVLIILIIIYAFVVLYEYFIDKKKFHNRVINHSFIQNQLDFAVYSALIKNIDDALEIIQNINECDTLIKQCAEVTPNIDNDCDTKSDKHIQYWKNKYVSMLKLRFNFIFDLYSVCRPKLTDTAKKNCDEIIAQIKTRIN